MNKRINISPENIKDIKYNIDDLVYTYSIFKFI